MSRERRLQFAIGVGAAGVVAAVLTAWAMARSPILVRPAHAGFFFSSSAALYMGTGAYIWWRQPSSRLGPLVAGLGLVEAVAGSLSASANAVVFSLGLVAWAGLIVAVAYVWLSFPSGRLDSPLERWFIAVFALGTALLWVLILALAPTLPSAAPELDCGSRCPPNGLLIAGGSASIGAALAVALGVLFTLGSVGVITLVFNKARSPSPIRRRIMTPLAVVLILVFAVFVTSIFVFPQYPGTLQAFELADWLAFVAVLPALLIGLARARAYGAISVGRAAIDASRTPVTPVGAQRLIAEALGDPSLKLALWAPERGSYLDVQGADVELPADTARRRVTRVVHDGHPFAALIHAPTLEADSDIVEALAASTLLHLENARLVEEVRSSRARIVATAREERLRLERDLHDGAQQRLMAIQIKLRLAQQAESGEDALSEQLEDINAEATEAVEELRTLAHGLYPSVLRDGGLVDAFLALATRSPIPIRVKGKREHIGRCRGEVEAAVYFCALEAVQNAVKHAGSGAQIEISLERDEACLRFSICDDGVGMEITTSRDGIGLQNMRDRVSAVSGELEIASSPGKGTCVRGTVPKAWPDPGPGVGGSSTSAASGDAFRRRAPLSNASMCSKTAAPNKTTSPPSSAR